MKIRDSRSLRHEDWTFREAEVLLGKHREWRQALGLVSVPDSRLSIASCSVGTKQPSTAPEEHGGHHKANARGE